MESDSRRERERLKEEYKEHYRKMRDAKERLSRVEKRRNITDALRNMDISQLMDTFDDFLFKVKSKVAKVEAQLDVAMDSLVPADEGFEAAERRDEELRKEQAKETLRQVKIEMGLLYSELERQAGVIKVEKTVGSDNKATGDKSSGTANQESKKSQ